MDEAVAVLRRAIELSPDYGEAHNNLGIALQAQGMRDDAVASYRRALDCGRIPRKSSTTWAPRCKSKRGWTSGRLLPPRHRGQSGLWRGA